jgi:hypothetical protein
LDVNECVPYILGDGFSRENVVFWPSSPHKAAKTTIGYNFEGPFILRDPTDNFSPMSAQKSDGIRLFKGMFLILLQLKYVDGENRLPYLSRYVQTQP